VSDISCLALGWGLPFPDWPLNDVEKHPKTGAPGSTRLPVEFYVCLGAQSSHCGQLRVGEAELEQTDTMINHMIVSYISCLALGWGLLFFDWALNEVEKHPKAEPWISNAVTIGGASAVLSPIIQWGHAVAYGNAVSPGTHAQYLKQVSI